MEIGAHPARATELEFVEINGLDVVQVKFTFTDGPNKGLNIMWKGWIGGKTPETAKLNAARTHESLTICGFDGDDDDTIKRNVVNLVIVEKPYTRKDGTQGMGPEVQFINDINRISGGKPLPPMDAGKRAAAKSRLKAAALQSKSKSTEPSGVPFDAEDNF
jgi:hypothetical protein